MFSKQIDMRVIKPHPFEPVLWGRCLECGQPKAYTLHIPTHDFQVSQKSQVCMCGYSELHVIHRRLT